MIKLGVEVINVGGVGGGVLWCRSLLSSTGTFWEERLKRCLKTRLTGGLHRMTASMSDLL